MENTSKHHRRLLMHFCDSISEINRSIINPVVAPLTLEKLAPVMSMVARARADYLKALFEQTVEAGNEVDIAQVDVSNLRRARERYEELIAAANAMETMIERGYLEVAGT
ncbi:MAG: hypothetical protein AB8G18_07165 [Gammaproteobacteria bacterium]